MWCTVVYSVIGEESVLFVCLLYTGLVVCPSCKLYLLQLEIWQEFLSLLLCFIVCFLRQIANLDLLYFIVLFCAQYLRTKMLSLQVPRVTLLFQCSCPVWTKSFNANRLTISEDCYRDTIHYCNDHCAFLSVSLKCGSNRVLHYVYEEKTCIRLFLCDFDQK